MQGDWPPHIRSRIDLLNFVIFPQIKQFVGPVFFFHSLKSEIGNVIFNGSYGLVDTGEKKLLVTCRHVVEDFRKPNQA